VKHGVNIPLNNVYLTIEKYSSN